MHLQSGTEDPHQTELTSNLKFYLNVHKMYQFFPNIPASQVIPGRFVNCNRTRSF